MKKIKLAALLGVCLSVASAFAQEWPNKPVRLISPYAAGGVGDTLYRVFGNALEAKLNQRFVIDNKTGATGIVGTEFVAKAAPDGHTLALVASSHAINPSMMKKLPYDTVKGFEPVVLTHVVPLMLATKGDPPALPGRQ
jgi:tripartite-type tricarboxylate transporter receptor subunit TctC